jgi:hypothetical protein
MPALPAEGIPSPPVSAIPLGKQRIDTLIYGTGARMARRLANVVSARLVLRRNMASSAEDRGIRIVELHSDSRSCDDDGAIPAACIASDHHRATAAETLRRGRHWEDQAQRHTRNEKP